MPNPVFVLDSDTMEILDCNESVTGVYGFQKGEIQHTSFLNFFDPEERYRYDLELHATHFIKQVRHSTKDGKTIFVNIHISPSEYLGREALLVTTSDITKRLMAEQQLIQASKMATLGEMSAGVAHELNQPLSVIKTASNFVMKKVRREEPIDPQILRTMAEEIDSHVDRASKIINQLREFGRKADVKKERVQANEVLNRALEMFNQQLKLREIEVIRDFEDDLPMILADANRLEQVFINLIINARDAIEEKCEQLPGLEFAKRIFLKTSSEGNFVTVEIRDSGVGIPKAIRDRIFEPFFTTKKVGQGTGLGLSISYGIVQDYQGAIKVETVENEGSTFIVQFPRADDH
jgi:histidine kinase